MADYTSSLPVRTRDDIELQVKTKTGTSLSVVGSDFDIRDLNESQDSILIYGWDGSSNQKVLVNSAGRLQVDVVSGAGGHEYQDGVSNTSAYGTLILGDDGTNLQTVAVDTNGRLQIDIVGSLPAGSNSIGTVGLDAGTNEIGKVRITDGTEEAGVDVNNNLQVNLNAVGVTAVPISRDSNANSATNPIYVKTVEEEVGGEVHDFDQAVNVGIGSQSTHTYTVSSGKTLLLKSIIVTASGALKAEIKVGPSGSTVTKAVVFTSMATPTAQPEFNPPIEVSAGNVVEIVRTNRAGGIQDLYSTIIGVEV